TLFKGISYNKFVLGITIFSFVICNQGLTTILSISVPVLNAIYPVSIMLIVLGLCDNFIKGNRFIYPLTILGTAVISVIYAVDGIGISLGFISTICRSLPLYDLGFGWVIITAAMLVISFVLNAVMGKKQNA
ncbi:MAG: branched-chain amino acid transport system II carrier protein, partial [Oscillospiraceae bacterium]|nr:branched-chain amino acid transport system II carrier protein [Oscillospiraceae bacterium]